ncbi:MAG TPA: alpha/beta hydrolase [Xanthobacteraceae bacterium]|jgi:pimeloyl-ACP methyl ester carboxylesterase
MAVEQRIARVNSGDVSLFYRVFGSPGKTPLVILHGSNYYDSYDWINVATQLASDRQVVTPERRGWGESTWSPSKNYTRDALTDDLRAVIGEMKWTEKPIIAGHSGAGPTVIAFAVNYASELSKLVLVDSQMNRDEDAVAGPTVGNPPLVFPSIEAGMAQFAKLNNPPRVAHDRDRMLHALIKVETGFMLKRDPDNGNKKPIGVAEKPPKFPLREMWAELGMVKTPTLLIRGTRSDRFPPETVARFTKEYPHIPQETVDSQHDIPGQAPDAFVAHMRKFIA